MAWCWDSLRCVLCTPVGEAQNLELVNESTTHACDYGKVRLCVTYGHMFHVHLASHLFLLSLHLSSHVIAVLYFCILSAMSVDGNGIIITRYSHSWSNVFRLSNLEFLQIFHHSLRIDANWSLVVACWTLEFKFKDKVPCAQQVMSTRQYFRNGASHGSIRVGENDIWSSTETL